MAVLRRYEELDILPDKHSILNIQVSYDGTWLTRVHTSHIGIDLLWKYIQGMY